LRPQSDRRSEHHLDAPAHPLERAGGQQDLAAPG